MAALSVGHRRWWVNGGSVDNGVVSVPRVAVHVGVVGWLVIGWLVVDGRDDGGAVGVLGDAIGVPGGGDGGGVVSGVDDGSGNGGALGIPGDEVSAPGGERMAPSAG